MWIIKWIISAVIILLVLGFALQNQGHTVSLTFIPGRYETEFVPVWLVVYTSFAAGVLFWLIVSIVHVIRLKSENRRIRKENERLRQELDGLRNLSIEEDLTLPETSPTKATAEITNASVKAGPEPQAPF